MCVAQLDRALGYGPRCRGFESSHARLLQEESRTDCPAFFLQRTYGSDSNGFDLRSASVGAKRMSAGHPAPSRARLLQEESRTDCPAFFIQRTYGSDSNRFDLHSVPVGAEQMSAGHSAPSHARYIVRKAGQKRR